LARWETSSGRARDQQRIKIEETLQQGLEAEKSDSKENPYLITIREKKRGAPIGKVSTKRKEGGPRSWKNQFLLFRL